MIFDGKPPGSRPMLAFEDDANAVFELLGDYGSECHRTQDGLADLGPAACRLHRQLAENNAREADPFAGHDLASWPYQDGRTDTAIALELLHDGGG